MSQKKRVLVASTKDVTTGTVTIAKVPESVISTPKFSNAKPVTVEGITYPSRSDAIRKLLEAGMTKAKIAKAIGASYSFVQTIAGRTGFDYSIIKSKTRASIASKKIIDGEINDLERLPKLHEKIEKMINKKINLEASLAKAIAEVERISLLSVANVPTVVEESVVIA